MVFHTISRVLSVSLFSAAKEDIPGAQREGGRGQHQRNANVQEGPIKLHIHPWFHLPFRSLLFV